MAEEIEEIRKTTSKFLENITPTHSMIEREDFDEGSAVVLAVSLQEDANPQAVYSKLERMIEALDEYDRAHDGAGLRLDGNRSEAKAGMLKMVLVPQEGHFSEGLQSAVEILKRDADELPGVVKSETALAA